MHQGDHCGDRDTTGSAKLQLLIASEVRFVRESLGELLTRDDAIDVVGYAADAGQTLTLTSRLHPDIVLLDAAVRGGINTVRSLHELMTGLRIIAFALRESVESVLAWAEAGAAGYIPNTAAPSDLQALIGEISAGRQACSGVVAAGLLQRIASRAARPPTPSHYPKALTRRELEIVRLISAGLSNKDIARRLNIGLATTKSHVHNALGKLQVQRRGQVATWMQAEYL